MTRLALNLVQLDIGITTGRRERVTVMEREEASPALWNLNTSVKSLMRALAI